MTIRRPAVLLGLGFFLSLSVACDSGAPTAPSPSPGVPSPAPVVVVGTWRLQSVDGQPLPWTLPESDSGGFDKVEVTAEVITALASGRFTMDTTLRTTDGSNVFLETIPDTGTYVVDGSVVTFRFDSDPGGEPALGTVSGNVLALDDGFVYIRD